MRSNGDPRVALDASALLAFLHREPGGDYVASLLDQAVISLVNLAEVLTVAFRNHNKPPSVLQPELVALGIRPFEFTLADAVEAAELWPATKAQGLSLGDRACLALGKRLGVKVLSAERHRDWSKLGLKGVKIETIR